MIGMQVQHKAYGTGIVTGHEDGKITVDFSGVERRFQFPEAFERFLTTDDAELREMVERAFREKAELRQKEEEARKKAQEEKDAVLAAAKSKPDITTEESVSWDRGNVSNWIIPCNPKWFDIYGAFRCLKTIDWRQTVKSINPGDTVYIYSGLPIQAVTHKCRVIRVDITPAEVDSSDHGFNLETSDSNESLQPYDRFMRLQLITEYDPTVLPLSKLAEYGLVGNIQGQRHTGPHIQAAIDSIGQ